MEDGEQESQYPSLTFVAHTPYTYINHLPVLLHTATQNEEKGDERCQNTSRFVSLPQMNVMKQMY